MKRKELKKQTWKKEMTKDFSQYLIKDQDNRIVCRVHLDDFKNREASEVVLTADLITVAPRLYKIFRCLKNYHQKNK